jgi:hypothetical protein
MNMRLHQTGKRVIVLREFAAVALILAAAGGFCISPVRHCEAKPKQSHPYVLAGPLSVTPERIQSQFLADAETGFDARDEFNQPVKRPEATGALRALFIENIFGLLARTEIHSVSKIKEFLSKHVNPAALAFALPVWDFIRVAFAVVTSQSKRQSILSLLPFSILPLVVISSLHFSYLIFTPKNRVAPLILRC